MEGGKEEKEEEDFTRDLASVAAGEVSVVRKKIKIIGCDDSQSPSQTKIRTVDNISFFASSFR